MPLPSRKGNHIGFAPTTTLGNIMDWLKTMTTNEYIACVKQYGCPRFNGKLWQRNYYEHIIRNETELNKIQESLRQGYLGEGERAIPLPFITGRQKSLETRAATLAEPIQAKAALAQAKRMAALDASKFRLTQEENKMEAAREAEKPIAGTSFYDPKTGKFITAPSDQGGFTLGAGQIRYDEKGNIIAGSAAGETVDTSYWVYLIKSGQASLSDVPGDYKNSVAQQLSTSGIVSKAAQNAIQQADVVLDKIGDLSSLVTSKNTGLTGQQLAKIGGTDAYKLSRELDTIKAVIGFQALQAMRDASPTGGALGQVSEMENRLLQATLGSLDIGLGEERLKANLKDIDRHFNNLKKILNAPATASVSYDAEGNVIIGGGETGGSSIYDW